MSPKLAESLLERKAYLAEDFAENAPGYVIEPEEKDGKYPAGSVEVGGKHYDHDPACR